MSSPALIHLLQYALSNKLAFAAWKNPGERYEAVAGPVQPASLQINTLSSGFLVQPFQGEAMLVPADWHIKADQWISAIPGQIIDPVYWHEGMYPEHFLSEQAFCTLVEEAVQTIRSGALHKIVLARHEEKPLPPDIDLPSLFFRLQTAYPDAFIALVSLPGYGTWIGASPEVLVNITSDHIETVALAGTIAPGQMFTSKENDEQELVSVFIRGQFADIDLPVQETHDLLQRSGHLQHLVTRFRAVLKTPGDSQKASQLAVRLHPTPAVAGLPQAASIKYILQHEGAERALYSGCWGPVNLLQPARLMVNLRCMQVWPGKAVLYAGCGITGHSVPQAEWNETREKMQVMARMIV